jgi:N-acetylneuraminic acid mutarotase
VTAFTDPVTGQYQLRAPSTGSYTVVISPITQGYEPVSKKLTVGAKGATWDVSDPVNEVTCTAPGYQRVVTMTQDFADPTKPAGWTVDTTADPQNAWIFDGAEASLGGNGPVPNQTGGSGTNYAMAYENTTGESDTALVSPELTLSSSPDPVLSFDQADFPPSGSQQLVEVSGDGGTTWTREWADTPSTNSGSISVPLPQAARKSSVRVRFLYTDTGGDGANVGAYWQVDDLTVASCSPETGALLVGRVTDANTGLSLNGATVSSSSRPGQSSTTAATPGNAAVGGGLYRLFSSMTGRRAFTASQAGYVSRTSSMTVRAGQVTQASFRLDAGRVAVTSAPVTATATLGSRATATVTVRNTGTAAAVATITPTWSAGSALPAAGSAGARQGAPLQRVSLGGHFVPSVAALDGAAHATARPASAPAAGPEPAPGAFPQDTASNAAAADPVTGKIYVVGGSDDSDAATTGAYVLNPATGRWTALPPLSHARAGAQAAFIGGRLYVTGGYDDSSAGNPVPFTEIFDPSADRWLTGASVPDVYYGAATAVLDGKMYVVGGCAVTPSFCGQDTVQVYSPGSNEWSLAAPYPAQVGFLACGGIGGELYCAGGTNDLTGSTTSGYAYNPGTNSWSPIPDMPIDLWGGAYAAANGQLLISGGITDESSVVTNQGYAFDPGTDTWSRLPNTSGDPAYLGGSACGLYRIGGLDGAEDPPFPTTTVASLPDYDGCGGQPWLSVSSSQLTLAPGQAKTVTVTMNAATKLILQPGTFAAALQVSDAATPYPSQDLQVRLTATPPATWGKIAGTLTGQSCNGGTAPLTAVTVQISGRHGSWFPATDSRGHYVFWLNKNNTPVTVITAPADWQPQYATATVRPRGTVTRNFALAPVGNCS